MEARGTTRPTDTGWVTRTKRRSPESKKKPTSPAVTLQTITAWKNNPTALTCEQAQAFNTFCKKTLKERKCEQNEDVRTLQAVRGVMSFILGQNKCLSNQLNYITHYLTPNGKRAEARALFSALLTKSDLDPALQTSTTLLNVAIGEFWDQNYFNAQNLPASVRVPYEQLLNSNGRDKTAYQNLLLAIEIAITAPPQPRPLACPELIVLLNQFQSPDYVQHAFGWDHFTHENCTPAFRIMSYLKVRALGAHSTIKFIMINDYLDMVARHPESLTTAKLDAFIQDVQSKHPTYDGRSQFIRARNQVTYYHQWKSGLSTSDKELFHKVQECIQHPQSVSDSEAVQRLHAFVIRHDEMLPPVLKSQIQRAYYLRCNTILSSNSAELCRKHITELRHCANWLPDEQRYLSVKTRVYLACAQLSQLKNLLQKFPSTDHPSVARKLRTFEGIIKLAEGQDTEGWQLLAPVLGTVSTACFQSLMGYTMPASLGMLGDDRQTTREDSYFCQLQLNQFAPQLAEIRKRRQLFLIQMKHLPLQKAQSNTYHYSSSSSETSPDSSPETPTRKFELAPGAHLSRSNNPTNPLAFNRPLSGTLMTPHITGNHHIHNAVFRSPAPVSWYPGTTIYNNP